MATPQQMKRTSFVKVYIFPLSQEKMVEMYKSGQKNGGNVQIQLKKFGGNVHFWLKKFGGN